MAMSNVVSVCTKPRIILANPIRVQMRQFFYFGIGIGSLTNNSKNHIESLKVTSTRFFATLRDSRQLYAIPKIENRTRLESRRVV